MCINYVAVCVFAGVHNDAKSIQCHWRVKGGCSYNALEGGSARDTTGN